MPIEPYANPDRKPYTGPLKWVPDNANGNDVGFGYKATVIKRGRFSNDYINSNGATVGITTIGIGTGQNIPAWPIQSAFRPLQNPDQANFIVPSAPFLLYANTDGSLEYRILFQTPSGQSEKRRASAITIDYNLIVDPNDENVIGHLYESDKTLIASGNENSINWSKYPWGIIETISGTTYTEWPGINTGIGTSDVTNQELKITGIDPGITTFRNLTVRFGEHNFGSDYPLLDGIRIRNRYTIPSLQLQLNKVMMFEVEANTQRDRVNIDYDQVPCSHLQYCYLVNFGYNPLTQGAIVPSGSGANFHVKVFVPENKYFDGVSGFAHSTELRFLIFSMPAYGISPFNISLGGLIEGLSNPGAYYTVFVGPIAGKKTVRYFCSNDIIKSANARIIRLDYTPIQEGTLSLSLQHAINYSGATAPDPNNISWEDIFSLNLNNMPEPNSSAEEGYVASYTYAAKENQPEQWYRTIQNNTNNTPIVGIPTYSELWSDNTILSLYESTSQSPQTGNFTITKRIDHISNQPVTATDFANIQPFATFVVPNNLAITHPIAVNKGFWNLTYDASCTDNTYTNTHIFARMWFAPDTPPDTILNVNTNPEQKKKTEITFRYDNSQPSGQKTQVIIGNIPDNNWTQEIIVSPPLNINSTPLYLRRYADIAKQNNKTVTQFDFPYSSITKGCMVLAFYQITYITDKGETQLAEENKILDDNSPNLPLINITFDGATDGIETMMRQTQSQRFLYERANNYIESYYVGFNTLPLSTNRYQYGIGTLPPVTTNDPENLYSTTYPVNNTYSPFYSLLTLQETSGTPQDVNVVIPYTKISEAKENASSFSADFITLLPSAGMGVVGIGTWQIDMLLNTNTIQANKIDSEYKIEIFLASADGIITERIYISDWTTDTAKSFTFSLGLEFPISSGNIQLALRLTARAWSKDGTSIDIQALQEEMNAGGINYHLGAWIKQLSVVQNTLQCSKIVQNIYAGGSPAYYEDLPLIPGPDLGGNDGFYVASKENLVVAITFPDKPWPVSGCFYSPAWQHFLPKDVEVDFRADPRLNDATLATKYLRFRTVPTTIDGKPVTTQFLAIGADTETTSTRTQIVKPGVETFDTDNSIKYYTQSNATSTNDVQISKEIEDTNSKVYMSYPDIIIKNNNGSNQIVVVGNRLGQVTNDLTVKTVGSDNAGWIFQNQGRNTSNLSQPSSISKSLLYTKAVNSSYGNRIYVSGWINPGVVAIKSADLQYASADLDPLGAYWIVDGDSTNLILESRKYLPMGNINGVCVQDFPAFTISSGGNIIVAYSLENRPGELVARTARESMRFEAPLYTIISFKAWGLSQYSQLNICAPNLLWIHELNTIFLTFWCGGKIFMSQVGSLNQTGTTLSPITLVAGNHNLSDTSNKANTSFSILESRGYLINNSEDDQEQDVPRHRCGMLFQDGLHVYYLDNNMKLNVRAINGQYVGAALQLD